MNKGTKKTFSKKLIEFYILVRFFSFFFPSPFVSINLHFTTINYRLLPGESTLRPKVPGRNLRVVDVTGWGRRKLKCQPYLSEISQDWRVNRTN